MVPKFRQNYKVNIKIAIHQVTENQYQMTSYFKSKVNNPRDQKLIEIISSWNVASAYNITKKTVHLKTITEKDKNKKQRT